MEHAAERKRSTSDVMRALPRAIDGLELPAVEKISRDSQEDPFEVLVATLLSARRRIADDRCGVSPAFQGRAHAVDHGQPDGETDRAADLPRELLSAQGGAREANLPHPRRQFGGRVPGTMEELLTLPGVGRKTANLVLILSFKSLRNICVDTHVHRISNRLGWVETETPEETEQALYKATH